MLFYRRKYGFAQLEINCRRLNSTLFDCVLNEVEKKEFKRKDKTKIARRITTHFNNRFNLDKDDKCVNPKHSNNHTLCVRTNNEFLVSGTGKTISIIRCTFRCVTIQFEVMNLNAVATSKAVDVFVEFHFRLSDWTHAHEKYSMDKHCVCIPYILSGTRRSCATTNQTNSIDKRTFFRRVRTHSLRS